MTNAHSFPLFKLPKEEQIRVLRNTKSYTNIYLSFLSKRGKALIKSLQLKTDPIFLKIDSTLELIGFFSITFYFSAPDVSARMLSTPKNVKCLVLDDELEYYHYMNLNMELKDWIDHMLFIYNQHKLLFIGFHIGSERFDLEAIKNAMPSFEKIIIAGNLNLTSTNAIINKFPHTDGLCVDIKVFNGPQLNNRKRFMENFGILELTDFSDAFSDPMDLNSLLICNAKDLGIDNSALSEKEVNRFLKLWVKGANSRLEFIYIQFSQFQVSMEAIIKGFNCQNVNTAEQFTFKNQVYNKSESTRTLAMFDIYRHDGIKGTIVFRDVEGLIMDFLVYHK
ncbi:hypothetical protein CAEBREN_16178 [Caenorhabditis brenneri]|uniref:F-box domain-containing protein n=1 Tax=Caenorhabditis brenneri TaxID=135651 RepID=G0MC92_CAEBE|nr:hypothetical protein CAEBREN_16178 [Caenorhabditis brenneri]